MNLDDVPFIQAKYFLKGRTKPIRLVVIHDAECAETPHAADDLGKYGQHPDYPSSWHISCDSGSCERSVQDEDTAYAAPPVNSEALHIELAGYQAQTVDQWADPYSDAVLDNAAAIVRQWCDKYDIPIEHLTNDALQSGEHGIVGHAQVSAVYKKSDHTDPDPNFPFDDFIWRVQQAG